MFIVYFWNEEGEQVGKCATFNSLVAAKQHILNKSNWPASAAEATLSDEWQTTTFFRKDLV